MSPGGFDRDFIISYLKQGLGPLIDVIPWHPFYQADPLDPAFDRYASDVREFKKVCESYGFRGEYMATEWTWSAPYPPTIEVWTDGNPRVVISEMMKAKYAAQLTIKHVGLDMVSLWNETFQTQGLQWSIGLLRNTFTADPLPPTQPEPVYYVQRTLSTALEDVSPIDLTVELGALAARCEVWAFVRGNGERLVAIWLKGRASDRASGRETDVLLSDVHAEHVVAIDTLNGREQELTVEHTEQGALLKGMLIYDFPILLKF